MGACAGVKGGGALLKVDVDVLDADGVDRARGAARALIVAVDCSLDDAHVELRAVASEARLALLLVGILVKNFLCEWPHTVGDDSARPAQQVLLLRCLPRWVSRL